MVHGAWNLVRNLAGPPKLPAPKARKARRLPHLPRKVTGAVEHQAPGLACIQPACVATVGAEHLRGLVTISHHGWSGWCSRCSAVQVQLERLLLSPRSRSVIGSRALATVRREGLDAPPAARHIPGAGRVQRR